MLVHEIGILWVPTGMSMPHHNQTMELTTWFLNLPLDEYIDNTKHKVWISNPRLHEAQLEVKKPKKRSRISFRTRKNRKANKKHKKRQAKQNGKKELRKTQNQNKMSKKCSNLKTPFESNSP
jgi:hypothetical protein